MLIVCFIVCACPLDRLYQSEYQERLLREVHPREIVRPETFEVRSTLFLVKTGGITMKDEIKRELERKIAAKFDQALRPKAPPQKVISEEQRKAEQQAYVESLYRAALKGLDHPTNRPSKNK